MPADFFTKVLEFIWIAWPIWLPIVSINILLNVWFSYKRREWIRDQGSILLEIRLPKNIDKSPAAMEMVLEGIFEDVVGSLTDVYLKGRVRDWFSLEIVSIGGQVKFFIWAFPRWKDIIEARIYTHYPGAEVLEVEDYAMSTVYDPETMNVFGVSTKLNKPDAYPIKTYIEYELDKGNKEEEEIVDPITPLLEYLGSLKSGEQAWIQILIQGHRKQGFQDVRIFSKPDWKKGITDELTKMIEKETLIKPTEGTPSSLLNLSKTQIQTVAAIERNAGKLAYDTMIRVVYIAPNDIFVKTRGTGILGSIRSFGSKNLNGIRPDAFYPGITYPWEDFLGIKKARSLKMLVNAYKLRSFFNVPYKHFGGQPFVLTTEELATIFHFPGATATTPTLTRVLSKKAEAPSNLPI